MVSRIRVSRPATGRETLRGSAGWGHAVLSAPLRCQLPVEPIAHGAAHHQFEVLAFEPGQFLGEEGHALQPRARHAGDVGPPEKTLRPEGVVKLPDVFVDVAK